MKAKEWNKLLDEYLETSKISDGANRWEELDDFQRALINEIRKSIARRKRK